MTTETITKEDEEVINDTSTSWACLLSQDCPGAQLENPMRLKAGLPLLRWCPACVDDQPQTREQCVKNHKANDQYYGAILPYQGYSE